jgi:hypothetical protein
LVPWLMVTEARAHVGETVPPALVPMLGVMGMLSQAAPLPPCAEGFAFRAPIAGPLLGAASLPHARALSANTPLRP